MGIFRTSIREYVQSQLKLREAILKLGKDDISRYASTNFTRSIKIAGEIIKEFPDVKIEIHIDVGSDMRCKSRGLVDMLKGWASSAGFSCKIKPEAWASASVADKHTK